MKIEKNPDFVGMLYEGIQQSDREAQLRFCTDAHGNVVTDGAGHPIPRENLQLRSWAIGPGGPLHSLRDSAWLWKTDEIVQAILHIESDHGLYGDINGRIKEPLYNGEGSTVSQNMVKFTRGVKPRIQPADEASEPGPQPEAQPEAQPESKRRSGRPPKTLLKNENKPALEQAAPVPTNTVPESSLVDFINDKIDKAVEHLSEQHRKDTDEIKKHVTLLTTLLHDALFQKANAHMMLANIWDVDSLGQESCVKVKGGFEPVLDFDTLRKYGDDILVYDRKPDTTNGSEQSD